MSRRASGGKESDQGDTYEIVSILVLRKSRYDDVPKESCLESQ